MDSRPIGIFDSGLGGLTVAKEIYKRLPHESTIYIGDTARYPYGSRSRQTIIRFATQLANFLLKQKVKAIVIACATASSQALDAIQELSPVPVYGVIYGPSLEAVRSTKNGYIGVIGTRGTISSKTFQKKLVAIDETIKVRSYACPLFVPLIEEGYTSGKIVELAITQHLKPLKSSNIDTLILGCTHYPLISGSIQAYLGKKVTLINPGRELSKYLNGEIEKMDMQNQAGKASHRYYTTDDPQLFRKTASQFLGQPLTNQTKHLPLEELT